MEEYTKLINRLLDKVEVAEGGEWATRNRLLQTYKEVEELKKENEELINENHDLRLKVEELEE